MPADDHPMLVLREGQVERERFPIDQSEIILGRDPAADRQIDAPGISRRHARLYQQGDDYWLEDLGSTNGTFVNGRAVRKQTLADGDVIEIGRCAVRYQVHAGTVAGAPAAEVEGLESDLASLPVPPAGRGARVRVLTGAARGRELWLTKPVTTIGRRGFAVAAIRRSAHGFELAHVEGAHIPSVNGVSVDGGPIALQNRDQIVMGAVRLEYLDA